MKSNKIFISLILNIVFSSLLLIFYGFFDFVLLFARDLVLGFGGERSDVVGINIPMFLIFFLMVLSIVIIVMSSTRFRFVKKQVNNENFKKEKFISLVVLMIIFAIINIIIAICFIYSLLILVLFILFAVLYTILAVLILCDVKKLKRLSQINS